MKSNMPRSWYKLPIAERESLKKMMSQIVYEQVDEEEAELQVAWIKLACTILHDVFGFGEIRLLRFIAAWKRKYRQCQRTGSKAERDAWLDTEMQRCFPKGGFPQERIDEMKGD